MEPSPEPPRSAIAMESTSTCASACASGSTSATTVDPPPASIATAHLARFEFSDLGTKILMVEWHPGTTTNTTTNTTSSSSTDAGADTAAAADAVPTAGSNKVATHAPSNELAPKPNTDAAPETGAQAASPRQSISDASVWEVSWPGKSTYLPARDTDQDEAGTRRRVYFLLPPEAAIPTNVTITPPGRPSIVVKPLPAIFPPGFDVEPGTRGVLHTLWAKKRLSELQCEMDAEMRANAESVGLEMALTEKQWIIENFLPPPMAPALMSPRSPVPGRLGDKLKGLRLATSPEDLMPSPTANTFTGADVPSQTLSPLGGDIAVSSFSAIPRPHGRTESASLNAVMKGDPAPINPSSRDGEDDLFALPLSPRSPDMKRGPFSALS